MLHVGIPHITSLISAPWCAWTMLVLLLCAVLAEWFQPGVVVQSPASLFAHTDRTYKESPTNIMGQFMITLFRLGTIGMALCLCFCPAGNAPFAAFWLACGWIMAMWLIKMLCNVLVDFTFYLSRRFGTVYEPYGDLMTLGSIALYPIVLAMIHFGTPIVSRWVFGIWAILIIGIWIYRSARQFMVSLVAVVYLIMYIATLEIVPIAALIYVSDKTISNI